MAARDLVVDAKISITLEGNDITNWVLGAEHNRNLCTGVGTLSLRISSTLLYAHVNGDIVRFYEDGNLTGRFYVSSAGEDMKGNILLGCQDDSKWMQAYFVDSHYTTSGGSSRYWIGRILAEAGISYNFTTASNGYVMAAEDIIGYETAYDIVMRLIQQSGWYFYFNGSGVCQIGSLDTNWGSPSYTLNQADGEILSEELNSNDEQLRNRVVVWGGIPASEESGTIYSVIETQTPWNIDEYDDRTIVYQNNYISDYGTALTLGKKLHDEYSKTVSIKTYIVSGYVSAEVGDVIFCDTDIFLGNGRLTDKTVSVTNSGYKTTLIIDQRCPRMFAYWSSLDEYVYASTEGSGVWRKPFSSSTWSNWSTGLTNLVILDLKIKNGLFACTSNDYRVFYRKASGSSWITFSPTGFFDVAGVEYDLADLVAAGCGINEQTGEIIYGFSYEAGRKSWVVHRAPDGTYTVTQVIADSGSEEYILVDVDTNGVNTIASAKVSRLVPNPTTEMFEEVDGKLESVFQPITQVTSIDPRIVSLGTKDTGNVNVSALSTTTLTLSMHYGTDDKLYILTKSVLKILDLSTGGSTSYNHGGTFTSTGSINSFVYPENDDLIHIINGTDHWTFVPSTLTLTNIAYFAVSSNSIMVGSKVFHAYGSSIVGDGTAHLVCYDVTTATVVSDLQTSSLWLGGTPEDAVGASAPFICAGKVYVGATGTSHEEYAYRQVNIYATGAKMSMNLDGTGGSYEILSLGSWDVSGYNVSISVACGMLTRNKGNDAYVYQAGGCTYAPQPYVGVTEAFAESKVVNWNTGAVLESTSQSFDSVTATGATTWEFGHCNGAGGISFGQGSSGSFVGRTSAVVVIRHYTDQTPGDYYAYDFKTGSSFSVNSWFGSYSKYSTTINEYDGTIIGQDGAFAQKVLDFGGNEVATLVGAGFNHDSWVHLPRHYIYWDKGSTSFVYSYSNTVTSGDLPQPTVSGEGGVILNMGTPTLSGDTFGAEELTQYPLQLEISRESPVVCYGGTTSGEGDGEMLLSAAALSGDFVGVSRFIGLSPLEFMNFYADARVVDVLGLTNDINGWEYLDPPTKFERYVMATRPMPSGETMGGIYNLESDQWFDAWSLFETISGSPHRLESTNYIYPSPYIFVSISGAPSTFWQLDPGYDEIFINRSINLPASNITCIRADDKI